MKEQDHIQQELQQLAPELAKLRAQPKTDPIPSPDYFQRLTEQVLEQAQADEKQPLRVVWKERSYSKRHLRSWAAAAAVLLVLSSSIYLFLPANRAADGLATLSKSEAQTYIEYNIHEFNINLMLEAELVRADDESLPVGLIPELQEEEAEEYLYELLQNEELEELF